MQKVHLGSGQKFPRFELDLFQVLVLIISHLYPAVSNPVIRVSIFEKAHKRQERGGPFKEKKKLGR